MHDQGKPGWLVVAIPVVGMAISFLIEFSSTVSVPIDPSKLPSGHDFPTHVNVPKSPVVFLIGWLIGMLSIVTTIVLLARKSQEGSNKYGPSPHQT